MSGNFKIYSGAAPTTAALVKIATGTAIKTLLQLAPPAGTSLTLLSWGYSYDQPPGAIGVVELIQTDVAASVGTAHVAANVVKLDPNSPASQLQYGTALTGYNFGTEGATTASRLFDVQELPTTASGSQFGYSYQWLPDERPIVAVSTFLRVRVTTPTTGVGMVAWVCWDE